MALRALAAMIPVVCSCSGDSPTRAEIPWYPVALPAYSSPLWLNDTLLAFNHAPFASMIVRPSMDSLAGLWAVSMNGSTMRRILPWYVESADIDFHREEMIYEADTDIIRLRMVHSIPDTASVVIVISEGRTFHPRWMADAESIVYRRTDTSYGVWIAPVDGGSQHFVVNADQPDAHPTLPRILYVEFGPEAWTRGLVEVDRATGSRLTVLPHQENRIWRPRYSSDGRFVAFLEQSSSTGLKSLKVVEINTARSRVLAVDQGWSDQILIDYSWHPTRSLIAYSRYRPNDDRFEQNGVIMLVDAQTGATNLLVTHAPTAMAKSHVR